MATSARGWVKANPYNGAVLAKTYSFTAPTSGSTITASKINDIKALVNQELTRRGLSTISGSATTGEEISADFIKSFNTNMNNASTIDPPRKQTSVSGSTGDVRSGQTFDALFTEGFVFDVSGTWLADDPPAFSVAAYKLSTVSSGTTITSSGIKSIIDGVKSAGAQCLCNCNYCTCNCNYCTCNCNYACTCNCNYSDRRLKRNIKFLKNILGINVYSFNYIWSDEEHVGVMAQELLVTKYKKSVIKDKSGFFMVDYSKLPFKI